jgi:hypothetical protein
MLGYLKDYEDSQHLRKFKLKASNSPTDTASCLTSSFVGLGFLVTLIGLPTTKYMGFWNGTGPLQTIVGRSFTAHHTHSEARSFYFNACLKHGHRNLLETIQNAKFYLFSSLPAAS